MDMKVTQRQNKPIATPRGKGYDERKISRHEVRPAVPRRKEYDETKEGRDASKTTDNNSKNSCRSEEVFTWP